MTLLLEILTLGIKRNSSNITYKTPPDLVPSFLTVNTDCLLAHYVSATVAFFLFQNTPSLFPCQSFCSLDSAYNVPLYLWAPINNMFFNVMISGSPKVVSRLTTSASSGNITEI